MNEQVGVVHGRFQLFHNDHLKYVLAAKDRCDHLVVGICNPDTALTAYSAANPHRSSLKENPFTYYERYQMIKGTLVENGISLNDFDIVPFPINYPELIPAYVPMKAKYYLTIYDQWGEEKEIKLRSIGLNSVRAVISRKICSYPFLLLLDTMSRSGKEKYEVLMRGEVTQKTIALVIKNAKLDANILKFAMKMYLNYQKRKVQNTHSKISVKKLVGEGIGKAEVEGLDEKAVAGSEQREKSGEK